MAKENSVSVLQISFLLEEHLIELNFTLYLNHSIEAAHIHLSNVLS